MIVTHNMQQAARVSDRTAFFLMGELVEFDVTDTLFTRPSDQRTEDYITGPIWIRTGSMTILRHTSSDYEADLEGSGGGF